VRLMWGAILTNVSLLSADNSADQKEMTVSHGEKVILSPADTNLGEGSRRCAEWLVGPAPGRWSRKTQSMPLWDPASSTLYSPQKRLVRLNLARISRRVIAPMLILR